MVIRQIKDVKSCLPNSMPIHCFITCLNDEYFAGKTICQVYLNAMILRERLTIMLICLMVYRFIGINPTKWTVISSKTNMAPYIAVIGRVPEAHLIFNVRCTSESLGSSWELCKLCTEMSRHFLLITLSLHLSVTLPLSLKGSRLRNKHHIFVCFC